MTQPVVEPRPTAAKSAMIAVAVLGLSGGLQTVDPNIASVAPFIGLFGTVVGIILTFDTISKKGNMGQDLVASGIADALVATAMGLFAAIPAVIAYNFLTDRVSQVVLEMEAVAMERIYYMVQREGLSLSDMPQEAPAPAMKTPAYAKE